MTAPTVPTAPLPSLDLTKYEGHTPGPWLLERLSGDFTYGVRVNGDCVSGYTAFIRTDWLHADQRAELEANARLIADAPQLFAALLTMQRERDALISAKGVVIQPPAIPETEYISYLRKFIAQLQDDKFRGEMRIHTLREQLAASERTCAEHWEALLKWKARAEAAERTVEGLREQIDALKK